MEVPTVLHFLKQTLDIPVLGAGGRPADLQGSHPGPSPSACGGGGLQGFHPGQGSTALVVKTADEPFECFFALFTGCKKVRGSPCSRSARAHAHLGSSELSAHKIAPFDDVTAWVVDYGGYGSIPHISCAKQESGQYFQ